jgi:hypothetical protein
MVHECPADLIGTGPSTRYPAHATTWLPDDAREREPFLGVRTATAVVFLLVATLTPRAEELLAAAEVERSLRDELDF